MALDNATATCFNFAGNLTLIPAVQTFMTACSPFVICFNLLVLYFAFKYVNFKQNLEQLFVVNMTAADLMFGTMYLTSVKHHMNIPDWFCKCFYVLAWTFNMASINFLLLLNVYKLIILFFPIYSFAYMSQLKVTVQVVFCWIVVAISAISFSFEPALTLLPNTCHSCIVQFDHKLYAIMIMCFYIIPLTVSLVLSMLIFGMAQSRSIRRKHHHNQRDVNNDDVAAADAREERKKMFGRIFFVFTSTVWASLTFLPYRISFFRISLCRYSYSTLPSDIIKNFTETPDDTITVLKDPICYPSVVEILQHLLMALLAFGFTINPLITICTQHIYRQRVVELLGRLRNCRSATSQTDHPQSYHNYSARNSRSCSYQPVSTNSTF